VRLLLDTHIFLWLNTEPERVGAWLTVIERNDTELFVSAASSWEMTIKWKLGKLALPEPPAGYLPSRISRLRALGLAITHAHVIEVGALPDHHRDPFDRLLIAQSRVEDLKLLTADPTIAAYDADVALIKQA
jgi:PIN domain nuclease of toxin-antitoxin system